MAIDELPLEFECAICGAVHQRDNQEDYLLLTHTEAERVYDAVCMEHGTMDVFSTFEVFDTRFAELDGYDFSAFSST